MKLWPALFIICLLTSTVQGVFAVQESEKDTDSGRISEAPLNKDYIENKNKFQPLEWLKQVVFRDQLGYIPEPADSSHFKGKKVSKKALEAEVQGISDIPAGDAGDIVSAPSTFDLRTEGRVSPVKNQGSCGSCWAFASYGSMESEALPTQLWDFSENNLKNTHGFDYGPCAGGNSQMATAYLTRWSGAVSEAADPYSATGTTSPTNLPVLEHAQEILTIPGRSGSLDNDNIKAALQTTGALYTTMYWSATYYNTSSRAYYYSGTSGSNHAVTIVGWDDNYSKSKFYPAAPGDGAFIVKNSWGTSWGNSGYFYLSYYDSRAGKSITAFTGESATNYNHIYQYDPLGWISSMGYGSNTAWAANVFTATSQEAVSAVGLSTNQLNTSYQISMYTNPTQGPLNPAGPATTVQGIIGIPGYHTITLPAPVTVKAGEKFSVVVRFQTPGYNYPITIEKPLNGYSSQATAGAGQSYISSTGTSWSDLTSSVPNANACLKAYTVNAGTSAPVAAFTGTPTIGTAPLTVAFVDASMNSPTSRAWTFGDGGTSTQTSPTHIYSAAGTYTVSLKVTNAGGSDTLTRAGYITVTSPTPPVASFTGAPATGTAPLTVAFTDTSTGNPTSYTWDFGDGGISDLRNPSHTYSAAGTYTVTLTATNTDGSSTTSRKDFVNVTAPSPSPTPTPVPTPVPAPVKASFTAAPVSGQPPLMAKFTDTSTGNPTSWTWDFGDGTGASIKSPSHTYDKPGVYTVTLTVKNENGSSKFTKKNCIKVQVSKARQKSYILLS